MGLKERFWWIPFGSVPEISAAELRNLLESHRTPQIIDVRTRMEWKNSRIRGAVSVPITELPWRLTDLELDKTRPVVAICLSAHRSIPAVRLLQKAGFENAAQLSGGMKSWWKLGYPAEKG